MLRCRQTDPQDVSVHNRIAAQQFVPADGAVEIDLYAFLCKFEFYYLLKHIEWEPTFGWEVQKDRHQGLPQPRTRHIPRL